MSNSDVNSDIEVGLLWCCHTCGRIGTRAQAERHSNVVGHPVVSCSPEETTAIREQWLTEGRSAVDGSFQQSWQRLGLTVIPGGLS